MPACGLAHHHRTSAICLTHVDDDPSNQRDKHEYGGYDDHVALEIVDPATCDHVPRVRNPSANACKKQHHMRQREMNTYASEIAATCQRSKRTRAWAPA